MLSLATHALQATATRVVPHTVGAIARRCFHGSSTCPAPLKRTALYGFHLEQGGKMVEFCGYEMPVQYQDGILKSHVHTREHASLFDVSHMGQLTLKGRDAVKFIEHLVPGDIGGLKDGQARLSIFTTEEGGIIDDTVISRHDDHLYIVVNAGCKDKDFAHIQEHIEKLGMDVTMEILDASHALVALQGPEAVVVMQKLVSNDLSRHSFMEGKRMNVGGIECLVTRCGYTGEDGFEISVPLEKATDLSHIFMEHPQVKPAGLGARDSLRLEAGLNLYGNDIDTTVSPIEAGLAWCIGRRRREEGGFLGASVILDQLKNGVSRKKVGMVVTGSPAREHTPIFDAEGTQVLGEVTSGTFSPCLGRPIAMGYVPKELSKAGTELLVEVRGRKAAAVVTKTPFVPTRYYKIPASG